MVTYHRWLLLPVVEHEKDLPNGETVTERGPKYVYGEDRLDGFASGGPFDRQQVEDAGYSHLLAYNDADEWRVVCAWGEGNDAWNALNEIHAQNHDTDTLADHGQDVEPVMQRQFDEWDGWPDNPPSESENTA